MATATESNPLTHRFNEMDIEIKAWEEQDSPDPEGNSFCLIVQTSGKDSVELRITDDFKLKEYRRRSPQT